MKRLISLFLTLLLVFALTLPVGAAKNDLQSQAEGTAAYLVKTVEKPRCGNIGGEWTVLGLARSGYAVPKNYYEDYYADTEDYVKSCKGVLHQKKYTEYSRVIIALTAIGKDPTDVGGYDILKPLGDFDKTVWQGINGPIWALIALDSGNYEVPKNSGAKTQATRQLYVDEILNHQLADGGWALGGEKDGKTPADPDMTGMALQALAKYQDQKKVKAATERALDCISAMQDENGGYASWGTTNSESCAQVLVALCELGISLDDTRFVKNGKSLLDNLLSFRQTDGGFLHVADGETGNNLMSTEQGFYALTAALRAQNGKSSLYRMSDAISIGSSSSGAKKGLPGKNAAVSLRPITKAGTSFSDVNYEDNITAIEALAAREIINGMGDGSFAPKKTMTRAEFATIVVKALGLTPKANGKFRDVAASAWYASYVGTANAFGIVNGVSDTEFNPAGTITRQEAAAMAARAAKLCGMDTALSGSEILDELSQFGDYTKAASWAKESLAFCFREGILDESVTDIQPKEAILRCEIAQMLYNLLSAAKLL